MKHFLNLHKAFQYQQFCPFCQKEMFIGYSEHQIIPNPESIKGFDETVKLSTGSFSFIIDCLDNRVLEFNSGNARLSGTIMFSVLACCNSCSRYSFVLQVHVNLNDMVVSAVTLNSESFSIEKEDTLYEVRNIYSTKKTEYNLYSKEEQHYRASDEPISLPLITWDLNNLDKTLERIKGLVIFS